MLGGSGISGHRQIAVDAVAAVGMQFDQVAVELVGAVLLDALTPGQQPLCAHFLAGLVDVRLPEFVEVGRIAGVGFQLLGRESHLHVVLVQLAVDGGLEPHVEESGLLHRSHIDDGAPVLQHHLSPGGGGQHVGSYLVAHLHVLWDAIFAERHFHLRLFARLVEPVGVVGHRQPQVVAAVGVVLGRSHHHRQLERHQHRHHLRHPFALHLFH